MADPSNGGSPRQTGGSGGGSGPSTPANQAARTGQQGAYRPGDTVNRMAGAAGEAGRRTAEMAGQAADKAREVANEATERGASLASEAKERLAEGARAQQDSVADRIADMAQAVHRSGEQLEGHQDWLAELVERGADQLSSLAEKVRGNDLRGLLGEIEDLARRQPLMLFGASMAAGFTLVRLGRVAASSTASQSEAGGERR